MIPVSSHRNTQKRSVLLKWNGFISSGLSKETKRQRNLKSKTEPRDEEKL
mgnify:CR=1 FL=1